MTTEIGLSDLLELLGYQAGEFYQACVKPVGGEFGTEVRAYIPDAIQPPLNPVADVWFGVCPTRGPTRQNAGRGGAADVTRLAAVWADLDVKPGGCHNLDVAQNITAALCSLLGTLPVAVTESGHGQQPIWAIENGAINGNLRELPGRVAELAPQLPDTDPGGRDAVQGTVPAVPGRSGTPGELDGLTTPAAAALLRRWGRLVAAGAERYGAGVDSVYDLPRILRAPRTVNWKNPAQPVQVHTYAVGGAPITIERLAEVLDEYGIPEMPDDGTDPGVVLSPPAEWQPAAHSCAYARQTTAQWLTDLPVARHPWLVAQATRLAAMKRNGCLAEQDWRDAEQMLMHRFHALVGRSQGDRSVAPGEVRDALNWGIQAAATFSEAHLASELGGHRHTTAPPPLTDDLPDFGQSSRRRIQGDIAAYWAARP